MRKRKGTEEEQLERDISNLFRSFLRRKWMRSLKRSMCMKEGRRLYNGPNKRQIYEYQCANCKVWFAEKEIQIDHIIPCGSLKLTKESILAFYNNLNDGQLQKLCKECHKIKTYNERWKKNDDECV